MIARAPARFIVTREGDTLAIGLPNGGVIYAPDFADADRAIHEWVRRDEGRRRCIRLGEIDWRI
jgi:hypothetical protein